MQKSPHGKSKYSRYYQNNCERIKRKRIFLNVKKKRFKKMFLLTFFKINQN